MLNEKTIKIKLVKSLIGRKPKHVSSAKALGLKKINQQISVLNNICNRGLIKKISYLLKIESE
jgi:large subunit ribosomal protein L30